METEKYFKNFTLTVAFILNNQANNYPSIYLQSCITELAKEILWINSA
jgi:hypothetical protein